MVRIISEQLIPPVTPDSTRKKLVEVYCKSTDTKPTQANYKLAMGSSAFEIDTGDKYFWDTENEEWIKPSAGGGD